MSAPPPGFAAAESGLADLRRAAASANASGDPATKNAALRKAGEQFEAVFVRLLMQEMRRTIPKSDLFEGSGNEREIYEGIADAALADGLARDGSLGIADMIVAQMGSSDTAPRENLANPSSTHAEPPERGFAGVAAGFNQTVTRGILNPTGQRPSFFAGEKNAQGVSTEEFLARHNRYSDGEES